MGTKQAKKIRKELRRMGAVDLISDITGQASAELSLKIDQSLKAHLKQKPVWLPYPIYIWLVKQLFIVEVSEGLNVEQVNNEN